MTAPDDLHTRIAAAIPRTLVSNPGITRELADRILAAVPELADAATNAAAVARVRALRDQWARGKWPPIYASELLGAIDRALDGEGA